MIYAIFAFLLLIIAYQFGAQTTRHKERTAAMEVYANFAGVWPIFPQHPQDYSVTAKAEWVREQFALHSNTFGPEVVAYYYGCTLSDGESTASMEWDAFILQATLDYHRRRVAHISERTKKDAKAAAVHFGGQVTNNEFLKP